MAAKNVPMGLMDPTGSNISYIAGVSKTLDFANLTPEELTIFERDLNKMSRYFSFERDLQMLFLEDHDIYLAAAAIAKKAFGMGFGGALPGSGEFGMQFIRAKTVLTGTSQVTTANDWLQSYATAGWQNVFGSSTYPVDLSLTTGLNPQNRVLLVFPKLYCTTIPKIREVRFTIGPTNYGIMSIEFRSISDLFLAGLPASPLITKNGNFYMRGNVGSAIGVVDGTAPLGLTFALAEYMTGSGQE